MRRYARRWSKQHGEATAAAYVPLSFAPGEAYQFEWSHEVVLLSGVTVIVKVAHVRLCRSRMLFVRAYPRETQEMVFDAHAGICSVQGDLRTRHLRQHEDGGRDDLCRQGPPLQWPLLTDVQSFLIDPVACTPASGWEKGQVENQVGLVRERFFTPRLRSRPTTR